tara:strand:+ start:195 stop:695 length:501 start_codon:yes stop_codon:yes gene_type:complete
MIEQKAIERYLKVKARATDTSSSENERDIAGKICARIEKQYPGIKEIAAEFDRIRSMGPETETYYQEAASARAQSYEETWRDKLRDWFTETVDQVTRGLSLVDVIDEEVDVEITSNTRTVHVKIRIPIDSALDVAEETGGSLQEYARLIGHRVGRDLAKAFEDSGY